MTAGQTERFVTRVIHVHRARVAAPDVSIVIPVYNEEGILREAVTELLDGLEQRARRRSHAPDLTFEVIIAENGSRDRTVELAEHLADERPDVRTFSLGEPNYGKALRRGILEARGTCVICEEIDLCDLDFHRRALEHLRHGDCDMVIGSKAMKGASDERPLFRRAATASSTACCASRSTSAAPTRTASRRSTARRCCRSSRRA